MIGIYSITSPTGKVYIGQSWDIRRRKHYYHNHKNCKDQIAISRSIEKYGFEAHIFSVIYIIYAHEATQELLDQKEIFFMQSFISDGITLLNMKNGGSRGKQHPESIRKTQEARKLQPPPTLGKKFSEESKKRMSQWQIGRKLSPEHAEKSRTLNMGRKHGEEARKNMSNAQKKVNTWTGRKHSEESRKKQSLKKIGNKINNKKVKRIDTQEVFPSLSDAAQSIGVSMKTLSARIRTGCKKEPFFTYDV